MMLSPLFDSQNFLFEDGSWELTALHREAADLTNMSEFWQEIEEEAGTLNIEPPAAGPLDLDSLLEWRLEEENNNAEPLALLSSTTDKLVHHDCMWAGKCHDKLHPGNQCNTPPVTETVQTAAPGRSLLLVQRSHLSNRRAPSPTTPPSPPRRPDTPLSLDEEDSPRFRHHVDIVNTTQRLLEDPRCSTVAADHSYTAKPTPKHARFENLGVQTPTDSEEEIDVVSVGVNSQASSLLAPRPALPTNPSMQDRHNLQRTVATAIGSSGRQLVTQVHHISRKRMAPPSPEPARKRGKTVPSRRPRTSPPKRRTTDSESDMDGSEVEKRSVHNNMERMRRIGLKNLFDDLKKQVPSTRDKERAPKVVILREAASLCRRLQAEDREREMLKKQQSRLLGRVKKLRMMLAASYH